MTKQYYECHLTIDSDNRLFVEDAVKQIGWTYSAIDNDIVIGQGTKMYATRHFNLRMGEANTVVALETARHELVERGINVIRAKVELVLFDERYGDTHAR